MSTSDLIAKLKAALGLRAGGSDHSCRPKCKVCKARGRAKDEQARRDRRAGKKYGPAPDGVDVFKGFREGK